MIKIQSVSGYITPLSSGTKLRKDYSTYSEEIRVYASGIKLKIDQVIERTETDASKIHNYKGDVWARVISENGAPIGYMAIKYHNAVSFAPLSICSANYIPKPEEPQPEEDTVFPDFIMVYGKENGSSVEVKYIPAKE